MATEKDMLYTYDNSKKHNNNGGNNTFYDIPRWVKNVDDLSEYLNATSAMGNVLKSLFGMNKSRHAGTSADRDAKKILHYGIRILLWLKRPENEDIEDVDLLIQLYNELPERKRIKFTNAINKDNGAKQLDLTIYNNYLEINPDRIFTHIESDVDFLIHAVIDDGGMIVIIQEGYVRGTTESYKKEDFKKQFKLKRI